MDKTITPIFKFYRIRQGNKTRTINGGKYGPYLYRDTIDNTLIASWDKPTKELSYLYKGQDIGYNTDALLYYKNI